MIRSPSLLRLRPTATSRAAAGPLFVVAAILLVIGGVAAGVAVWLLATSVVGGPVMFWDEVVPALGLSTFAMFVAYLFGFPGYVLLEPLRAAWWLDGTSLGYRRVMRTVWVDLATARVATGWHLATYRLVAVSRTGEVTLPLQYGGGTLPPEQLTAVADAILTGRDADDRATAVAQELRRLVSEPDAILPGAGTFDASPAQRRGSAKPALLLGLAVLLLLVGVSGARWAAEETHRWIEFRQAGECLAAPGPAGCQTDPAARIEDTSYCGGRYCGDTRTRYVLQLSGGGRTEAEFRHRVEGPAEGDEVAVRLFQDRVVALHDGSAWVETKSNPRIALPTKFAIASAFLGAGVGALIGAVATRRRTRRVATAPQLGMDRADLVLDPDPVGLRRAVLRLTADLGASARGRGHGDRHDRLLPAQALEESSRSRSRGLTPGQTLAARGWAAGDCAYG